MDPPAAIKKGDAWYIQSLPVPGGKPISCSFIEFDERGDYLDFQQYLHAYRKITDLARQDRLLVLLYVHGWRNNAQSGNVVAFNEFLKQLAASSFVQKRHVRVHGVYLAWRGNPVHPWIDKNEPAYQDTQQIYGDEPIVSSRLLRKSYYPLNLPETASYWNRKNVAENQVSGISLIHSIYALGYVVRRSNGTRPPNFVFLMGHSFGGLILEQSFVPATLARLTANWQVGDEEMEAGGSPDREKTPGLKPTVDSRHTTASLPANKVALFANPLPFDLVLLVNSAAPSIYAKQMSGSMVANHKAHARNKDMGTDAPVIISLTSEGDRATGRAHPWANVLAPFYPSLWHSYDSQGILAASPAKPPIKIPQAYYYQHTPGHNPLLVNHWIVPAPSALAEHRVEGSILQQNMEISDLPDRGKTDIATTPFRTSPRPGEVARTWAITTTPPDPRWSTYQDRLPLCVGPHAEKSDYWIIRCPKEIIADHNDIWNKQAMDMYAALFAKVVLLRTQKPD